jgi:hypothetical protein
MTQTGTLAGAGGGGHQADEGGDPVATIGRPEHPAGPSPPGPATTALSAALLALAAVSVTGAWRSATGRHDPGELAVVLAVAITGLAVVWFLDDALFRPHPRRRQVVRLGLGATAAGLGAVAWLGAAGTIDVATARSLAVGLCLARPLLGAVQASQRPRSVWWQLLGAIAVWNAGLVLYATLGPGLGPWDRLVWDTADQVSIYRYATLLVDGDFRPFAYLLGVPALVAPVTLVTGQATSDLAVGANLANTFFAPVQAVVVMPAFLWGAARVACRATGVRPAAARVGAGMVVAAGLVFAYALVVPPYVPDRHAGLVPRRLLGLVYGAEPLGYVALAGAMLVLARRDRPWNPVAVGLLTGLALTLHERFAPSAALFLVLLVVQRAHWRRAPAAAAAALAAFLPQLLYFRLVYAAGCSPTATPNGTTAVTVSSGWSPPASASACPGPSTRPASASTTWVSTAPTCWPPTGRRWWRWCWPWWCCCGAGPGSGRCGCSAWATSS